ncbi:MAG: PKD domain-containing protein [Candidatus Kuenenbacteria bacterium]
MMKKIMATFKKSASIFLMLLLFISSGFFIFGNVSNMKAQEAPSLSVTLDDTTPMSQSVLPGTSNFNFTKIKLSASNEDIRIDSIAVKRFGISADFDIENIRLFDGSTQIGPTISTITNGKATFYGLHLIILKNSSKTISINADIKNTAIVGSQIALGIDSASDITAIGNESGNTASISGSFPIKGNLMSIVASSANLPPVISGVSGPTTLKIGETGTWTINASDPENGQLTYSVVWGDEDASSGKRLELVPKDSAYTQTATFTHVYNKAGNFTPTFTVTDNQGLSAKTSISVNVGDENCQKICKEIGTRSEGWYDSCTGTLIKWENCSTTETKTCVKENESLGAIVPDNNKQCCEGLRPYIPADSAGIRIIGTRGICKKISASQSTQIDIPYKDGSLLKTKNGKQVYFVEDEKLKPITSMQTFKNHGFKMKDIIQVASGTMGKFEIDDEALLPYPDGALLKSAGKVYFVENEKLRPIDSIQTFKNHGFKTKNIIPVAPKTMEKFEIDNEALLPYPDGTLLKLAGKIYFVQDEKLRYVSSMKILRAHNLKLKNAIAVAPKIIDEYEIGEALLPYPDGALLKTADSGRIYFVQNDELRYVSSLKTFKSLNLKRKNIIIVAPEILDEYEEGEALK